jgi:ssDNA-binding replication factor A large subunit
VGEITSKQSNKQITKRELTLVDKSGFSVRLTLWGKQAEQFAADDSPVIAFKGVRVGEFGGKYRPIGPPCPILMSSRSIAVYGQRKHHEHQPRY